MEWHDKIMADIISGRGAREQMMELCEAASRARKSAEQLRDEDELLARRCITRGGERVELFCQTSDGDLPEGVPISTLSGLSLALPASFGAPDEQSAFEDCRAALELAVGSCLILHSPVGGDAVRLYTDTSRSSDEVYVVKNEALRSAICAGLRASAYGEVCFAVSVLDDADALVRMSALVREISGELLREGREFSALKLGAVIDGASSAVACDELLLSSDFLLVMLDRLVPVFAGGSGAALHRILGQISERAASAGKRAILHLGTDFDSSRVHGLLSLGFRSLCAPAENIRTAKLAVLSYPPAQERRT